MLSNRPQSTAETERCDDILVVDDTPANLVAFTAVLDQLGVRVVTANFGEAALRVLSERDFALLLLDVNMPTMDGFEVARRLRDGDLANGTPIIFITAHAHEDREVLDAYRLGAVDFLTKPIQPEILSAKARVFIDLARKAELNLHARSTISDIYENIAPADYSRDVLQESASLSVVPLAPCGWSDWGTPERVLRSLHGTKDFDDLVRRLSPAPSSHGHSGEVMVEVNAST